MYSTTRIPEPVAKRTRLVQDDVQAHMRRLNRPVTLCDLARQWTGTDRAPMAGDAAPRRIATLRHYCRRAGA